MHNPTADSKVRFLRVPLEKGKGSKRIRSGIICFELLLILPVLFILVIAIVQFAFHLAAHQKVDEASSRAARIAARGGDSVEIDRAVRQIIGERAFKLTKVETDYAVSHSGGRGDMIEVRVTVPASSLVPDLLGNIGLGLSNQKLVARTVTVRE